MSEKRGGFGDTNKDHNNDTDGSGSVEDDGDSGDQRRSLPSAAGAISSSTREQSGEGDQKPAAFGGPVDDRERVRRKREMNVIHSRRKRERQKIEVEVLRARSSEFSAKNMRTYRENKRLEKLQKEAEELVEFFLEQSDEVKESMNKAPATQSAAVLPNRQTSGGVASSPAGQHGQEQDQLAPNDALFSTSHIPPHLSASLLSNITARNLVAQQQTVSMQALLQQQQQHQHNALLQNELLTLQRNALQMAMLQGAGIGMGLANGSLPPNAQMLLPGVAQLFQLQQQHQQNQQQGNPNPTRSPLAQPDSTVEALGRLAASYHHAQVTSNPPPDQVYTSGSATSTTAATTGSSRAGSASIAPSIPSSPPRDDTPGTGSAESALSTLSSSSGVDATTEDVSNGKPKSMPSMPPLKKRKR